MAKTSTNVQPVKSNSESHNLRKKELGYVNKEDSHKNESLILSPIQETLKDIKARYLKSTKQKMQKKAVPIREAVIVLDDNSTMDDLKRLGEKLKETFGIKMMQIHIHDDEGHFDKNNNWKKNRHAHMVLNWTDEKGKSIKLNKYDMVEMQTITADVLKMERGESSDIKHLNAIQYKNFAEELKSEKLAKELKKLKKEVNVKTVTSTLLNKIKGSDSKTIKKQDTRLQELTSEVLELKDENSELKQKTSKLSDLTVLVDKYDHTLRNRDKELKLAREKAERLSQAQRRIDTLLMQMFRHQSDEAMKKLSNYAKKNSLIQEDEPIIKKQQNKQRKI